MNHKIHELLEASDKNIDVKASWISGYKQQLKKKQLDDVIKLSIQAVPTGLERAIKYQLHQIRSIVFISALWMSPITLFAPVLL